MACNISLKDRFQPSAENDGVWIFNGYSIDDTTYSNYGPLIIGQPVGSGDNPTIDSELLDQGYYKFIYLIDTPGCDDSAETKLYVQDICYPSSSPGQSLKSYNIDICYDVDADDPATIDVLNILQGAVQSGCTVDLSSATITQQGGLTFTLPVDYIIDSSAMYASITSPVEGQVYSFVYNVNFNSDNTETYFSCTSCSVLLGINFRIKGSINLIDQNVGTVDNPISVSNGIGLGNTYNDGLDWSAIVDNVTQNTYFGEGPDVTSGAPDLITTIPGDIPGQNLPENNIVEAGTDVSVAEYLCAHNLGDRLRYSPSSNPFTCSELSSRPIRINTLPTGLYAFYMCPSGFITDCNKCQTIYVEGSCSSIYENAQIDVTFYPNTTDPVTLSYSGVECGSPNTLDGEWITPSSDPNGPFINAILAPTLDLVDASLNPIYGAGTYTLELTCGTCVETFTYNYCPPELYTATFDADDGEITLIKVGNSVVGTPVITWTDPSLNSITNSNTLYTVESCGTYTITIVVNSGQPGECSQTISIDVCGITNEVTYGNDILTANIDCDYSASPSPFVCNSGDEDYLWALYNLSGGNYIVNEDETLDLNTLDLNTSIDGVYISTYQCGSCMASDSYTICPNTNDFDLILEQNGCALDVTLDITTAGLTFSPNSYKIYIVNETTGDTQLYGSGQITPTNPLSGSITTTISNQSLNPQPAPTDVIRADIQFNYLYPETQIASSSCLFASNNTINVDTNLCPDLQASLSYNSADLILTGNANPTGYHPSGNIQFNSWRFEDTGASFPANNGNITLTLDPINTPVYYGWYSAICNVTFDNCNPQPTCSDTAAQIVCPPSNLIDDNATITYVETTPENYVKAQLTTTVFANPNISGNQIQYNIVFKSLAIPDPDNDVFTSIEVLSVPNLINPYTVQVYEGSYNTDVVGPFEVRIDFLRITYKYINGGTEHVCVYGETTDTATGYNSNINRYDNYKACYKAQGDSDAEIRFTIPMSIFYNDLGTIDQSRYDSASISVVLDGGSNPGTYSVDLQTLTSYSGYTTFIDSTASNGYPLRTFIIKAPLLNVSFVNTSTSNVSLTFDDISNNTQNADAKDLTQSC
jgi:hypothetical protein